MYDFKTWLDSKNPEKFLDDVRTGDKTLNQIALNHNSPEILKKILSHPKVGESTLPTILKKSLKNNWDTITKSAIQHDNNNDSSLSAMVSHIVNAPHDFNNSFLHPTVDHDNLLHHIVDHKHAGPQTFGYISRNTNNPILHNKIVDNEKATDYNLRDIANNTHDKNIIDKIIKHKNVSDVPLSALADQKKVSINTLINHPKTSDHTLAAIASHTSDPNIHNKLLDHKKSGESTTDAITERSDDPKIHNRIVENPNTSAKGLYNIMRKNTDPEIHKKILQHKNSMYYDVYSSMKKIHDPETHRLMLKHYGSDMTNGQIKELTKKYGLPEPYIQKDESNYDKVSPENLEKVKHHLSKLAARTEAAKNRSIDTGTEKEPLVTPIKSRQRRYNFTEQLLVKIKG